MIKSTDQDEINTIISKLKSHATRKVFYVDVGNMAPEQAKAHLDAIKAKMKK